MFSGVYVAACPAIEIALNITAMMNLNLDLHRHQSERAQILSQIVAAAQSLFYWNMSTK
jgi:hypothetical protein